MRSCDLVINEEIDEGGNGKIFDGYYCQHPVAIKYMMDDLDSTLNIKDFVKEVCMHKKLSHPNIVRFYGVCEPLRKKEFGPGIVMEKCSMGSLMELIDHARSLTTAVIDF